jgi:hypothetical protein
MLLHKVYSKRGPISVSHLLAKILVYYRPFQIIYVYFWRAYSVLTTVPAPHFYSRVAIRGTDQLFRYFANCLLPMFLYF